MPRGRKATSSALDTTILTQVSPETPIAGDLVAHDQMAVMATQQEARVRAVAQQLGYQLPAECTDPDLIQRDIAANMRRSVEACLEVGRGLRVLKEACEHGQFMARLDVLGIEPRVAQRFMASAVKFSNAASTPLLKAAGNQTKLFELLVLDDEQMEELELTGQTGELKLDDIATMSVKELRAALRKEKAERESAVAQAKAAACAELAAKDKVIAQKSQRIAELVADKNRREGMTEAERLAELESELQAATLVACGDLLVVRGRIHDIHALERCPQGLHAAMQGALQRVIAEVMGIAADYGITLELTPEWAADPDLGDPNADADINGDWRRGE